MAAMSDEQLVSWARAPATSPVPATFRITKQLWEAVGEEPRVHLGGDMFIYGSLESAVAMGERAADRLVASA